MAALFSSLWRRGGCYSSSSAARRRSSAALIGCVYGASDVSFASAGSAGA
jgi:hypothetical protein